MPLTWTRSKKFSSGKDKHIIATKNIKKKKRKTFIRPGKDCQNIEFGTSCLPDNPFEYLLKTIPTIRYTANVAKNLKINCTIAANYHPEVSCA